jgi:hypothetical protein
MSQSFDKAFQGRQFVKLGLGPYQGRFAPLGAERGGVPDAETVANYSEIRDGQVVNYASARIVERDDLTRAHSTVLGAKALRPLGLIPIQSEIRLKGE